MTRIRHDYDEDDVRVRPNRRGSRPRTKERPTHHGAHNGMVTAVDRGRYTLLLDGRIVTAMRARELGRHGIVLGDQVAVVGDVSGTPGSLARIVRVEPRTTTLRRTADDTDPIERVVVANANQLLVVTALTDPTPRPRLIDRCLVAAYDAGLTPMLVLTKSDLTSPEPFLAHYTPLDVPAVVTRMDADTGAIHGLEELRELLAGHVSVMVGHSGVGKSTLVNALVPAACRATGHVNAVTGRGRHTSTSAVALPLPNEAGWVIDTPGVRSFGLAHVDPADFIHNFPDLDAGTDECPRSCDHTPPHCALDAWVDNGGGGPAGPSRLTSLRRLLHSRIPQNGD